MIYYPFMLGAQTLPKQQGIKPRLNIKLPPNVKKAKEFPIQNLYNGQLRKTGKTEMGKCPFHNEDTPSFAIYPETNTWNCFAGCGGGDVITFYMRLHEVSFGSAVVELTK